MTGILLAAALVGGTGLLIGVLLGVAGEKFKVEEDPREVAIREALPGNNCGGCGYAGCDALAKAIAAGEAKSNACPVGGAATAAAIGEIMGTSDEVVHRVAFVRCGGTCEKTKVKYDYHGVKSCIEAAGTTGGGPKACAYGCLGYGTCVAACQFDAMHLVDGIAVADRDRCTACGKCVSACPKGLIELIPYEAKTQVRCTSKDRGKDVMAVCEVGCIGCKICEKNCPENAITVENNLAHIDYDKCTGCGICAEKCPKKVIIAR